MHDARMIGLAEALGIAKSRRDVAAALALLHPDMVLETPCLGTRARGLDANAAALERWFTTFPDYAVALEGHATGDGTLISWGTVRMTMTGDRFGVQPNGRRAVLPVLIQFGLRDDRIAHERFVFDLATLCAQSGVSTDAVRARLFGDDLRPSPSRSVTRREAAA